MPRCCARGEELEGAVQDILVKVVALATAELNAFRSHRLDEMMRVDKELEQAIGEKERRLGAYLHHREHHQ
jgi:hypothetical protein